MQSITTYLHTLFFTHHSVWVIFIGLIILSYILEDLALVTAATLATEGIAPVHIALLAVFIGITSGDVLMYLFGKLSNKIKYLRYRAFRNKNFKSLSKRFHRHAFLSIFLLRFIPGLRSIGYTISGFVEIKPIIFIIPVVLASAIWTTSVFFAIYYVGTAIIVHFGWMKWLLVPVIVAIFLIFFISNKLISKKFK